jgi:hypothetical protein
MPANQGTSQKARKAASNALACAASSTAPVAPPAGVIAVSRRLW